jgi:hypothetical protein
MASSLVMSLIGAAGLAAALLVGCGDNDAKPVSSKAGQSCARTADCADGLSCIANVCYSNSASGGSGGSGGAAVAGPVLGGDGESCTSRKDCEDGLACFNQRCTKSDTTGAGGDTAAAPTAQLGARGETCRVNADCSTGLSCVPSTTAGSIGVCDVTSYGVTPTGMYCAGECSEASDCCQLPLAEQSAEGIKSCFDLTALIASSAVDCTATPEDKLCFLDATYCTGCVAKGATVWKCTDNACVYNVACTVAAGTDTADGCPQYTRLGNSVPGCNPKSLKCAAASGCAKNADCTSLPVADSLGADTCSDGECTCYAGDHQCYRKCSRDLDCATGKTCDQKSFVCTPDPVCTTDEQCAERNGSIAYKCQQDTGRCALTCATDRDCSASGRVVNGARVDTFANSVCSDGLCTSVAGDCTDDTQCGTTGGYKTFCIARPALGPDTTVSSAVTN